MFATSEKMKSFGGFLQALASWERAENSRSGIDYPGEFEIIVRDAGIETGDSESTVARKFEGWHRRPHEKQVFETALSRARRAYGAITSGRG